MKLIIKNSLTKKLITATAIGSLALLVNLGANAEIYKWTDAKGVVHYTANKPTQKKVKTENIEVKIRNAAGKYNKSTNKTTTKSSRSSSDDDKEKTKMAGPDAALISYCKTQRSNLSGLQENFRNIWQGADGKKKRLNQEQRKLKIDLLQKQIAEDCAEV
ncbi:MAG: DUF4124 domain-containing protein [Cocleimonas sp.]|nr:DUF4124 domain-containing protein [Cocleimonas sp.]